MLSKAYQTLLSRTTMSYRGSFSVRCSINGTCFTTQHRWFGQPVAQTHPHLLSTDEVTPGITKLNYKTRRQNFMELLLEQSKNCWLSEQHVVIIPSGCEQYMTYDIRYVFRQNTEFLYLTGFQEPDSVLVMIGTKSDMPNHTSILFVREKDAHSDLWEGSRSGLDGAFTLTGVDRTESMANFSTIMDSTLTKLAKANVWYASTSKQRFVHPEIHSKSIQTALRNVHKDLIIDPSPIFQELRLIKSEEEVKLMQTSNDIASAAFQEVIKFSKPNVQEAHLWAKMDFECRLGGAQYLAYQPVVAGGDRANTIHYIKNDQIVNVEQLVLMDAGCEYYGYASDITRTWPVSGYFTAPQLELYEALLEVQEHCVAACGEQGVSLHKLYDIMLTHLAQQLQRIGVIPPHISKYNAVMMARELCPHHVSHYLGMDVHDTDDVTRMRPLEPGMVITVEPGVYVPASRQDVPKWFRGTGIRIEDNVLITSEGYQNLTTCPKSAKALEQLASASN